MRKIILFLLLFTINPFCYAQLVNVENQRIQNDSIKRVTLLDVKYNFQNNNKEELSLINFSAIHQYKTIDLKNYILLLANIEYSMANGDELSNAGLLHLRYNRKVNSKLKLEAFLQYQYNKTLGIESRNLIGIGPRYKVNKSSRKMFYIGSLLMQEFEKTFNDTKSISYQRLSNYISFTFKNSKNTLEFNTVMYYQPNINNWSDYRHSIQSSLAINITSKLQLTTNFNYGFDSYSPINVNKRNFLISNGLKLNL